jgi:hypothetical protein
MGMINNISIIDNLNFNCDETVLVSLLDWYGIPYAPLFSYSWSFKFNRFGTRIYNCINTGKYGIRDVLMKFCNVNVIDYRTDRTNALKIIKDNVENDVPVIMNIDNYWCPWQGGYRKLSQEHTVIITGINMEKELLYCSDLVTWRISGQPVCLSFSDYYKGFKSIRIIKPFAIEQKPPLFDTIIDALSHINLNDFIFEKSMKKKTDDTRNYIKNEVNRYIDDLNKLADKINDYEKFENEIQKGLPLCEQPFFKGISKIGSGKRKFALTLDYLSKNFQIPELCELGKQLEMIGCYWSNHNKKYFFDIFELQKPSLDIKHCWSQKIKEIAEYESLFINKLMDFAFEIHQ